MPRKQPNLSGMRRNRWLVVEETTGMSSPSYLCECETCHRRKQMLAVTISDGVLQPCFCRSLAKKSGHIKAVGFEYRYGVHGRAVASCVCDCGRKFQIMASDVQRRKFCGHGCPLYKKYKRSLSRTGEAIKLIGDGLDNKAIIAETGMSRQRISQIRKDLRHD